MSHDSGKPQRQGERSRPTKASALGYLAILFAVAFLLLLFAYFQQRRSSSETSDALNRSVSAVSTIETMMTDNDALRQEVNALKEENLSLKEQYQAESQARGQQDSAVVALDYLWRIQRFWDRGNREEALALVNEFEAGGYAASLPATSPSGAAGNSPLEQYNALLDALDYRSEP